MTRPVLAALALALVYVGPVPAQEAPFALPTPMGGPVIGRDGKVLSALDTGPSAWSGGFELGLSGADGNTNILKLRTGFDFKYDSPDNFFVANAIYILTRLDEANIEQKAFVLARNELPVNGAWAWYAQGQLEYDESLTIDSRVAAHNGASLTIVRGANSVVKIRAGAGVAREEGGTINDWVPEGQAGGDVEYILTARSKFGASVDWYPDLHELSNYRIRVRAWFDFLIDPDLNAYLRLGVFDRYNSNAFGSKRNDVDYYMSLLIRF